VKGILMSPIIKPVNSGDIKSSGENGEAPGFDLEHLYRQETFTDLVFGSIQVLTPVTPDGKPDADRKTIYLGSANLMTPRGAIPVQCEIPADNFQDAAERFPAAVERSVEEMVSRAKEYERERAGGIVVPQTGGRIQMP